MTHDWRWWVVIAAILLVDLVAVLVIRAVRFESTSTYRRMHLGRLMVQWNAR